ncbi:MAG: DPP IV N-terminal domain-containing protein, partial [Bacteroidetes bacterium]|nr:DPP IV N-terminal domain-containing protein [Bacteroidota bacterium]
MKQINIFLLLIISFSTATSQIPTQVFSRLDVFQLEYANDPQISPSGSKIVYSRSGMDIMNDRRMSRLWILNADGSQHRKLTNREVNESSPRWSPDGSRIAFVSASDGGAEIYVYWVDTGQFAKLTQLERSPRGIRWSPDGTQIAFSMLVPEAPPVLVKPPNKPKGAKWAENPRVTTRLRHEADGSGYIEQGFSHLFVIPAEGGTPRQITSGDFHHRSLPVWAKDGKSLIFSSNRNPNWEYEFRNSEIYAVSTTDGTITQLTDRNGPDHSPTISPDGKKIAFLGFEDKIQTYQVTRLYLMNLDGS